MKSWGSKWSSLLVEHTATIRAFLRVVRWSFLADQALGPKTPTEVVGLRITALPPTWIYPVDKMKVHASRVQLEGMVLVETTVGRHNMAATEPDCGHRQYALVDTAMATETKIFDGSWPHLELYARYQLAVALAAK